MVFNPTLAEVNWTSAWITQLGAINICQKDMSSTTFTHAVQMILLVVYLISVGEPSVALQASPNLAGCSGL